MGAIRESIHRVRSFFAKRERDADLEAELRSHLELAIEEHVRGGMSAEEARRAALVQMGGVQQAKERQRAARGLPWVDVVLQDLRFTLRTLRRDLGFTTVAVLILGLGIGANVAVFSVVNTILLRALPFQEPERLVRILSRDPKGGESSMTYSADATQEFEQRNHSFAEVTGYYAFSSADNLKLAREGPPLPLTGIMVAGNFFKTLGVEPMLGRLFLAEECLPHSRPVVLLGYRFWKRQLGGRREIVGQAINLDGTPVTVVGVLPETFDFGSVFSPGAKTDVFTPIVMDDIRDQGNTLALVGRLKHGVSLTQAQAEADLLFPKLDFLVKHPEYGGDYTARLYGLKGYVSGKLRRSLIVLWCAVGMILLIVCVNLSNLLLARAAARSKEFALRSALGAGRWRLIGQMLTESLVLSGAGAVLGLAFALAVTTYLAHQTALALPLLNSVRVDGTAVLWTLLIAVVTAVVFGLAPGLKNSEVNLQDALKDSGQGSGQGRRQDGMRSALVISEVALACVLLVGAGLLLRSFLRVLDVDLGFEPSRAAAISVDYDDGRDAGKRSAIWREIVRRTGAIAGVEMTGISDHLPMDKNRSWGISAKGKSYRKGELQDTFVYMISPGYLQAIGMRVIAGRDFSWDDGAKSEKVVVINQTVARKLWPGEDAVGRIAMVNGSDTLVIGVIADVHESSAEESAGWQMYLPATQYGPAGAQLVIRTKLPLEMLAPTLMGTLRQMNAGQSMVELRPIQRLVDHASSPRRFFVWLVSVFAGLGLMLAALGIYGVISYSVTQRTQEIGVRMALGATAGRIQRGVVAKTLRLAMIGIAVGTVAALGASRLIASLLFGTSATDVTTFAGMIVLLGTVALLAGYVPARRASRIDPMVALRNG